MFNKMAQQIYDKAYMHTKKEDEFESLYGYDGDYTWISNNVDGSNASAQLPLGYNCEPLECEHEMAIYDSGFKRYEYCKKCNKDFGPC